MINNPQKEPTTVFFTIVAKNYISYARTLCDSISKHHPDAKIYIGLSDRLDGELDSDKENYEIIEADKLGLPDFSAFTFRYDVMEFSTAIKPHMFRWIFSNTNAQKVVYLDPDILVVSPLKKVLGLLDQGASAVLTPHLTSRLDDTYLPNENNMLQVGTYNLGFIALSRHEEAMKLVSWWSDRLEKGAIVDLANGLFTDQKWADLMPSLFGDVAVLRDPGYNAAYWNLMHRKIDQVDGKWMANDEPLAFFHFSGIDPRNPDIFSKHQDRFMLSDIGKLKELYNYYLEQLGANEYFETNKLTYAFNHLNDGTKIHAAMRSYFRQILDIKNSDVANPFDLTPTYFNQSEPLCKKKSIVTRFMYGLYNKYSDLQKSFDLESLDGQYEYANWFVSAGCHIYSVDRAYVESESDALNEKRKSVSINRSGYLTYFKMKAYLISYAFYRRNPALSRKLINLLPHRLKFKMRDSVKKKLHAPAPHIPAVVDKVNKYFKKVSNKSDVSLKSEAGVTLVGYVAGDFGVAENLRSVARCLDKIEYPFDIYETDTGNIYSETNNSFENKIANFSEKEIMLYCVNADQMLPVQERLGEQRVNGVYRIGYWFWELSRFPDEWLHALELVDEIWAPTQFIYDTLSKVTTKPVIHMPVAVDFEIQGQYSREVFNLPSGQFLFLVSFDFHSFSTRKNAAAVLESFKQAFSDNVDTVGLVIKTIHGEKHPEKYAELLGLAESDDRIHVLDKALSRDEMYGLINVCDCYVSLHRSEGFGLGMAEAMFLGKPVIGTAYSGNMDFMALDNSCLIDYKMILVKEHEYPHWENQQWADPDIKQSSEMMQKIHSNEHFVKSLAANAEHTMKPMHSSEIVSKKIKNRLDTISNEIRKRKS